MRRKLRDEGQDITQCILFWKIDQFLFCSFGGFGQYLIGIHKIILDGFFYKENTVLTTADENLKNVGFAFTELSIADYDSIRSSSDCRFK